jgi:hypothetical protein
MAPVGSAQALCIPLTRDMHTRILLWMMEAEMADMQTKGIQEIKKLKQE